VHDGYDLWIRPDSTIGIYTDKAVVCNTEGNCYGGTYQDGYVKAQVHTFGDFFVKLDTVPPVIVPVNIKNGANMALAKDIAFRIGDNLSGIKAYTGKIDGNWILMEWGFKTKILSYTFDKDITAGKHIFELTVTDNKNNSRTYTATFTR
jgi:hypothetical protein